MHAGIDHAGHEPISPQGRIVIIGAGPCGLACGRELSRLGHRNWVILERSGAAGGLASSVVDAAGFTWDLGGHVVFSHFGEFDALLEEVMGDDVHRHDRSSYVRFADRWVPYPFQNNLRHLPDDVRQECLDGLANAPGGSSEMDFARWMRAVFGKGITRHFMEPYNFKVWAHPPEAMSSKWIAERVSVIDYERALRNVRDERDDLAWGPNNTFSFPREGGTGEIYTRMAERLRERISFETEVETIDPDTRRLRTSRGVEPYDALVSTAPLDQLVAALDGVPPKVAEAAGQLHHNSVYMVGVGYAAPLRDERSWMYFPQRDVPFYRVTNFAKYAAANVPGGDVGRYCAYMTETAHSDVKPDDRATIAERVRRGLSDAGVVPHGSEVASVHVENIDYAYPIPTLTRDAALGVIHPWLEGRSILSRGRFGTWCYEIGNMDHAVKMGIDAARRLINGTPEELWRGPPKALATVAARE